MVILGLSMLNPGVNSATSAMAEFGLYLAVLGPLFWISRIRIDLAEMRRVIMILWTFQVISSVFGILQVYFPARFQFVVSTVIQGQGAGYMAMQHFQNAYGVSVYRPMGLTTRLAALRRRASSQCFLRLPSSCSTGADGYTSRRRARCLWAWRPSTSRKCA